MDRQSVEKFAAPRRRAPGAAADSAAGGAYQPQPVERRWIPKPGSQEKRPLGIPTVRDRVVQAALRHVIEPIFEQRFAEHSYGFRPGRGCKDALRRVRPAAEAGLQLGGGRGYQELLRHDSAGPTADRTCGEVVSDGRVLELIERFLKQEVMDGMERWTPEEGTPQGAVISPLLANIYLNPLDHGRWPGRDSRWCATPTTWSSCARARPKPTGSDPIRQMDRGPGLTLHPEKTRLVDAPERGGFDFLGYHFERGLRWPRKKSLEKLKDTIRSKTRRTAGRSLAQVIADVNPILRGWFGYFKHSHWTTFWTPWTAGFGCVYEASSASDTKAKAAAGGKTISAGPTPTLPSRGCSP